MSQTHETLDTALAAGASKITGAGSAVTIFSWFTASNLGIWIGILIGVAGLILNWYYKQRHDQRARETHDALMKKLAKNDDKITLGLFSNADD